MTQAQATFNVDQQNRLLEHGIHEENVFYSRLNFFSVFEGVLLTALVSLDAREGSLPELSWLIPVIGLVVTAMWWHAQEKKRQLVNVLGERIEALLPEFKDTILMFKSRRQRPVSASLYMTHGIPAIFLALWLYLLARLLLG